MEVFHLGEKLSAHLNALKKKGKTIGFVPTMGALHEGHISLIQASKAKADITVCSIFVNPTQFDESRDLSKYPRTVAADTKMLEDNNCDVLYLPAVEDVYPNGSELETPYEIGRLEHIIEGASRPGHYQGVAQVVHRLLTIVNPNWLFLGQKDYQQVMVLTQVIKHLNLSTHIEMCPIMREPDGLAMSSRNVRLKEDEHIAAVELSKTLSKLKTHYSEFELFKLHHWAVMNLNLHPLITVDYIKLCNAETLEEISEWNQAESVVVLGAIRIGEIRLIDNMIIF